MAIFCLATSISDLKERLSKIVCAYTYDASPSRLETSAQPVP